jgi:GNAT superfamily N-acetyltransferase
LTHALDIGFIDVTTDRAGAALWFPRMQTAVPDPVDYEQRLAAACGPWLARFQAIDTIFAQAHPNHRHHYLAFLAVAPDRQRHGIGSALLARHHHNLDQRGVPAYLEASTPTSRHLYHQHGYTDLNTEPIMLPDNGPPIWPMSRPPQPTTQPANTAA